MSIPNRHRSPESVRGRFSSADVRLQVDAIEKIFKLALADREHGGAFVHGPRDPERPPIKPLIKHAEPAAIEEQNLERRTCPNSSASKRLEVRAPQLIAMKGPVRPER